MACLAKEAHQETMRATARTDSIPSRHWRRAVLRSVGAYFFAAALLLLSKSAFRQVLSEFGDTEPGSLLFGALQLVIGTSAVAAAIGLVTRARWAAPFVAIYGVATVALLAVQPLFEPMDSGATWSIWLSAVAVGAAAAGVGWFAHRLARGAAAPRAAEARAPVQPPVTVLLAEARRPAEPVIGRGPDTHVFRDTENRDERTRASDASMNE